MHLSWWQWSTVGLPESLVIFTDTCLPVRMQALLVLPNPGWPCPAQLKLTREGGEPISVSYLSCRHLLRLLNGSGIKHDLSASPLTVLVHYQANITQVQLRT